MTDSKIDNITENKINEIFEQITKFDDNLMQQKLINIIEDVYKKYLTKLPIENIIYYKGQLHKNNLTIWDNENCFNDINKTIKLLKKNFSLYSITDLDNDKFKKIISQLNFSNIKLILPHIKYDKAKYKLLINGIKNNYLNNLINEFSTYDYDFLCKNYNFILQFNQLSKIITMTQEEIDSSEITKLQILLLLNTTSEIKVKRHILNKDINFLKLIINELKFETFQYIILNISTSLFFDLVDQIKLNYLVDSLPLLNDRILEFIIIKSETYRITRILEKLPVNKFINILHLISDNKIECLKYISDEQSDYILNLFDNINDNLYQEYFQNFSKQIIFILINTEYKSFVIDYVKHININTIISIANYVNFTDLIKILLKFEDDKVEYIISYLNKITISRISDFMDFDLITYGISDDKTLNLYKLFYNNLNLDLTKQAIKLLE